MNFCQLAVPRRGTEGEKRFRVLSLTHSKDYPVNRQKQEKVKDFQKQINQLVYKLYDLSKNEIAIIK